MILIRRDGEAWRSPSIAALSNEAALQRLLEESPTLLPGVDGPVIVAREVQVPHTGRADLVAVQMDGSITVVECKLQKNPEIRREVVGQILSYAGGLWGLSYLAFADLIERASGSSLSQVAQESTDEFESFQRAVEQNLEHGRMRLVVAVDAITDELRQSITYLNSMTRPEVEVFALELGYVRDGDVEILVPQSHGVESAASKERMSRAEPSRQWTEAEVLETIQRVDGKAASDAAKQIIDHVIERGDHLYWGEGANPSVTGWYNSGTRTYAVWSIYTRPTGSTFDINFQWIANRGVDPDVIDGFANRLRQAEVFQAKLVGLDAANYSRRPAFPLAESLTDPDTLRLVVDACDALLDADRRLIAE